MKNIILLSVIAIITLSFVGKLKKIYVIGDSISIQYGPFLKDYLAGSYDYERLKGDEEALKNLNEGMGSNGGPSRRVVSLLEALVKDPSFKPDILLLNCGLHDIKTDTATGRRQVEPDEYRSNLEKIYALAAKKDIKLVWMRTTPVNDSIHKSKSKDFFRYDKDVVLYNSIADDVFTKHAVTIIDLYTFTLGFGPSAYADHVHFTPEIKKLQAAYIAGFLSSMK